MVTRIRQILEYKQLTPTQFADLIGVGRPVVSHILSERNKPSLEVAQRIATAFQDISLGWLMFGAGEMLAADTSNPPSAPTAAPEPLPRPASELPQLVAPPTEAVPPKGATPELKIEEPPHLPAEATPSATFLPSSAALPRPFIASQPAPTAPLAPAPIAAPEPGALPGLSTPPEAAPDATPATPQPFRAARFVPSPQAGSAPVPEAAAPPAAPVVSPVPAAVIPASPPAPVTSALPASAGGEAALLPFLTESGKAIKRIVIFYRDGSFADYQPE